MHLYAPKYRPADAFNVPRGWELVERGTSNCFPLRRDLPLGDSLFGVIGYKDKLSPEQVESYELKYLGPGSTKGGAE